MSSRERIITPATAGSTFGDIWRYRELFYFLVWRDVKVRYKQTVIGVVWVMLQPFVSMVVFSFLFGTIAQIATGDTPYPIFVFTGLLFWNLFSRSVTVSAESLVANRNLVSKTYIPRIILPTASVMVNLVDFLFAVMVLAGLMLFFQFVPQLLGIVVIPFAIVATLFLSIGIGAIVAALNVRFRDIRFVVPYALQILLFLTPVIYPPTILEGRFRLLFSLNPMSEIIGAVRDSLLGSGSIALHAFFLAGVVSFGIFLSGIVFFAKQERSFADFV